MHSLFNSAPRKFKKLRNWCFYCVKTLSNLNLVILRCICNKGVRSRQEYINCFQLLTLVIWKPTDLRSWKVTLKIFLMCTQSNPYYLRRLNLNKLSQSYFIWRMQFILSRFIYKRIWTQRRVWSWLRMNAGGVLNTCKSNEPSG